MSQTKNEKEVEIRRLSENFTFYVVEYIAMIDGFFNSIILVDLVRDHKYYKDYLKYYQNQEFEPKKQLVKIILQSYYNDYLDKNYPAIFKEITTIQTWRNKLAHHSKHYKGQSDGSYIFVLANPIIGKEIIITKTEMEDLLPKFQKTVDKFGEIERHVSNDRRYSLSALIRAIQKKISES